MKKSLLILATLFLTVSATAQDRNERHPVPSRSGSLKSPANVANWGNMNGNFIAADINGNEHNLQAYLDAGKTVIIDYSTVWCGPCWQFHESGILDELHNNYGPDGTDELVILWIEIDAKTTLDNIRGDGGNDSRGDWTNGGAWPVPIINDVPERLCLAPFAELFENLVPTIFMVCPSGAYREITVEIWSPDGADLVYSLLGDCPDETSFPVVSTLSGPVENYVTRGNEFEASFFSLSDATATLTYQGGTPANTTWKSPGGTKTASTAAATTVTWEKAGTYDVKLEVTNANGTAKKMQTIEIFDIPDTDDKTIDFEAIMTGGVFAEDFFPYNWISVDKDNGRVYETFREQGVAGLSSFVIADKRIVEDEYRPFIEPYKGNKCVMSMANHSGTTNDDWFISPKIQLGSESSISLYVRSGGDKDWGAEEYRIAVSTTDQDPASFTAIGKTRTAPFKWEKVEINLSAYNNQAVYLAINNVGKDHYTFLIDNIEIKTKTANSVNRLLSDQFHIYPNPAKNTVHINCPDLFDIQLFDIRGKEVMNVAANSDNETVDVSNLPEGHYLIRITTKENKFGTHKLTVIKE
ncbi:MAG: choice-of-anchor J domain-containing protein [Prevotellaceae bacterium]|nr:choice-of-anchor J domain-containing protein [Prevotellaceae bacterium]